MFFVEQYPFPLVAISVDIFPILFFPAQVIMDIGVICDVIESIDLNSIVYGHMIDLYHLIIPTAKLYNTPFI